jgi:hypothetical protein
MEHLFSRARFAFASPLTPPECAERLQRHTQGWSPQTWTAPLTERPFVGTVSERGFQLGFRSFANRTLALAPSPAVQLRFRSSWKRVAKGRFVSQPPGTRVEVTTTLHPFTQWFCIGTTLFFLGAPLGMVLAEQARSGMALIAIGVGSCLMAGVWLVLFHLMWFLSDHVLGGKREPEVLLATLRSLLADAPAEVGTLSTPTSPGF